MRVLTVNKYPDSILRKRCKEVKEIDAKIKSLFDDMAMTMYSVKGIGLAAPQVGIDLRLIVIDTGEGLLKYANPEIISKDGISVLEEGCLSIPDVSVKIKRAAKIKVSALNANGTQETIDAEGLLSHAFQQEIDHINGKLIIDYMPFYKRIFFKIKG